MRRADGYRREVLYEEHDLDAVAKYLIKHDWSELSRVAATRSHGDDLVMGKSGRRLLIEAKGATSSDPRSKRSASSSRPARSVLMSVVLYLRALRWVSAGGADAAIAVPANRLHRLKIGEVAPAIQRAGIGVFWVHEDRRVEAECPWSL